MGELRHALGTLLSQHTHIHTPSTTTASFQNHIRTPPQGRRREGEGEEAHAARRRRQVQGLRAVKMNEWVVGMMAMIVMAMIMAMMMARARVPRKEHGTLLRRF